LSNELSDAKTAHELTVVAVLALVALEPEEPEFSLTGVEPFEFEIASGARACRTCGRGRARRGRVRPRARRLRVR
jgi:hypothetical protein